MRKVSLTWARAARAGGTDGQWHKGTVELGPIGQVQNHEHQAEGDDRLEAGGLPCEARRGHRRRQVACHPEEGAGQQRPSYHIFVSNVSVNK